MKFVRGRVLHRNTQGEASSQDDRDVFTKSEKWLPPLPKCEHGTWKTREQEILGFCRLCSVFEKLGSIGK